MSNDQLLDKMAQMMDARFEKMQEQIENLRTEFRGEFDIIKSNMTTLIKRQNHFSDELAKTNNELAETRQQLAKTNQDLAKTNQDLAKTNQDLAKTNQDLAKTNQELAKTNKKLDEHIEQSKIEHKIFRNKIETIELEMKIAN